MKNKPEDLRKMVEGLVKTLQDQGVKVTNAAFVNLDENSDINLVDKIMGEFEATKLNNVEEQQVSDEPCFCSACFNFDTFEEVLGKTGNYDYKTVELGDKDFEIKYYNGKYGQRIMMQEAQFKIPSNWTKEQIQTELYLATVAEDYDKVEILLTALQNLKK